MAQLSKIPPIKHKVYRGVNYDPKVIKGDILTFKSFTSTSSSLNVASGFTSNPDTKSPDQTFFVMHINSGKAIDKLSHFPKEDELLLEPYTQFQVLSVKK
jgi:hypothetical protein